MTEWTDEWMCKKAINMPDQHREYSLGHIRDYEHDVKDMNPRNNLFIDVKNRNPRNNLFIDVKERK